MLLSILPAFLPFMWGGRSVAHAAHAVWEATPLSHAVHPHAPVAVQFQRIAPLNTIQLLVSDAAVGPRSSVPPRRGVGEMRC